MFDLDQIPTAVKWIITVLIAGFIAQFGKMFAEYLIDRHRRKKEEQRMQADGRDGTRANAVQASVADYGSNGDIRNDDRSASAKARKKELKLLQKERKKHR